MQQSLDSILQGFHGRSEELIPILQRVQQHFGYLPKDALREVARFVRVPESRVYGVATFYGQFRFTPIGRKHIMVCCGTACHVRGAPEILQELEKRLGIKDGQATADLEYSLESVACIGTCGSSPCLMINKEVHGKLTPQGVLQVV